MLSNWNRKQQDPGLRLTLLNNKGVDVDSPLWGKANGSSATWAHTREVHLAGKKVIFLFAICANYGTCEGTGTKPR